MEMEYYRGHGFLDVERLRKKASKKPVSATVRRAKHKLRVLEKDGFKCVRCKNDKHLTIDHITKPEKRITHRGVNIYSERYQMQTLCVDCHLKKNALLRKFYKRIKKIEKNKSTGGK